MKRSLIIACLAICIISGAQAPNVLIMDANRLLVLKKHGQQYDERISDLKRQADTLLSMKPVSVMDKTFTPVSGNKHDYMSQAPYFWYDSSKPNGLPYMRKDGVR